MSKGHTIGARSLVRSWWRQPVGAGWWRRLFVAVVLVGTAIEVDAGANDEGGSADSRGPGRVVILANAQAPESLRLAHYYAEKRGIPVGNIVALPLALEETISWREFAGSLWQPLQDHCIRQGWIDAIAMAPEDVAGRRKNVVFRHAIAYLVVCRGVPLRIAPDPTLVDQPEQVLRSGAQIFAGNQASVDSELALLGMGTKPINGFVPNPLFRVDSVPVLDGPRVVKTTRLDGVTWDDARALVDQALAGERDGLVGQAFVDLGGPYPEGDRWFEALVDELRQCGFDPVVDREPTVMGPTARFDVPALYFGWYAADLTGPLTLPGMRLAPGAVAFHLHSFSAHTLRDAGKGWVGPLVSRGAAATAGNVYEPYLVLTENPVLWFRQLRRGWRLGDAAYYAMPALSWQTTVVGDPLYRPFAVSFEEQWARREQLSERLRPYLVLRKLHLMEADGLEEEALAIVDGEFDRAPSLVLGLAAARRWLQREQPQTATARLKALAVGANLKPEEWALCREAALLLDRLGAMPSALQLMRKLLLQSDLPPVLRQAWLPDGIRLAHRAGDNRQSIIWEREMADLRP